MVPRDAPAIERAAGIYAHTELLSRAVNCLTRNLVGDWENRRLGERVEYRDHHIARDGNGGSWGGAHESQKTVNR